ncbi:GNAT family N-acetyltransferase [Acetobacter senegalensis]|uniref:GNAT family N-acetyltransferase n=1 Tax=Acetobacter senegalensis TaxID=446692 RepID=UPI00264D5F78|nr:GNAT family protein [Acetobacter senegalensis]MDN7352482.1 GNAT family protein [Acetobacter senegalensis]
MNTGNEYLMGLAQPTLKGSLVTLRPMSDDDSPLLLEAAADGQLWTLNVTVVPGPGTAEQYVAKAMDGKRTGTVMPFVTLNRESGAVIGSTRFLKIDRMNRKLEIGSTWLGASMQRTGANTEAKYLMLTYAFETLRCVRVQFTTDELNEKSRAAIQRIGAKQEGIVRHERIMPDGRKRNSVLFSIIDDEWPDVKEMLLGKLSARPQQGG